MPTQSTDDWEASSQSPETRNWEAGTDAVAMTSTIKFKFRFLFAVVTTLFG